MRTRLWLASFAVAFVAVLVVGVPALVIGAGRGAAALAVIAALMGAAVVLAGWLTVVLASRLARPVEELAEAAARLGAGDPRPLGRRYGVADLDQVADGLDTSARRLSSLHAADRLVDAAGGDDRRRGRPGRGPGGRQRRPHPGRAAGRRGDPAARPGPA